MSDIHMVEQENTNGKQVTIMHATNVPVEIRNMFDFFVAFLPMFDFSEKVVTFGTDTNLIFYANVMENGDFDCKTLYYEEKDDRRNPVYSIFTQDADIRGCYLNAKSELTLVIGVPECDRYLVHCIVPNDDVNLKNYFKNKYLNNKN